MRETIAVMKDDLLDRSSISSTSNTLTVPSVCYMSSKRTLPVLTE